MFICYYLLYSIETKLGVFITSRWVLTRQPELLSYDVNKQHKTKDKNTMTTKLNSINSIDDSINISLTKYWAGDENKKAVHIQIIKDDDVLKATSLNL